jgi:hypothetical protein
MVYAVALGGLGLLTLVAIVRILVNASRSAADDFVTRPVLTRIRTEYHDL